MQIHKPAMHAPTAPMKQAAAAPMKQAAAHAATPGPQMKAPLKHDAVEFSGNKKKH